MRNYFFIDSENVYGNNFTKGLDLVKTTDVIYYFKGNCTPTDEAATLKELSDTGATFNIMDAHDENTKNALDFQLCTCAGFIAGEDKDASIYVMTNDFGFDAAVSFMSSYLRDKKGFKGEVKRVSNFTLQTKEEEQRGDLNSILADFPKKVRNKAQKALLHSTTKKDLHNLLQEELEQETANKVYYLLKDYKTSTAAKTSDKEDQE